MATPPSASGLADRILALVAGISTWKQVFILIVLGFAVLGGVMFYQHPEWVDVMFEDDTEPTLVNTERIEKELPVIRRDLHAEFVAVLGTAPERNECWLLAYDASPEIADTVAAIVVTTKLPLFTDSGAWNMGMIGVLNGEVPCVPLDENLQTEFVRQISIVEVCLVGLPPGPEALIGVLAVGFKEPRDRPARTRVRSALRSIALHWAQ